MVLSAGALAWQLISLFPSAVASGVGCGGGGLMVCVCVWGGGLKCVWEAVRGRECAEAQAFLCPWLSHTGEPAQGASREKHAWPKARVAVNVLHSDDLPT